MNISIEWLILLDIAIHALRVIYDYWSKINSPKPLTFLEFFMYMKDSEDDLKEFLEKHVKDPILREQIESELRTRDRINK